MSIINIINVLLSLRGKFRFRVEWLLEQNRTLISSNKRIATKRMNALGVRCILADVGDITEFTHAVKLYGIESVTHTDYIAIVFEKKG